MKILSLHPNQPPENFQGKISMDHFHQVIPWNEKIRDRLWTDLEENPERWEVMISSFKKWSRKKPSATRSQLIFCENCYRNSLENSTESFPGSRNAGGLSPMPRGRRKNLKSGHPRGSSCCVDLDLEGTTYITPSH